MGLLDDIETVGIGSRRFEPTWAASGRLTTAAETAKRVIAGEPVLSAVRDLLDQGGRASAEELDATLAEAPVLTGLRRADALIAGVVEHLAVSAHRDVPRWTDAPERFCDAFWFVTNTPGLRATSLAQAPMALKRRGVLWPARSMQRI